MNKPKTVSVIVNNEFLLVTSIIRGMIGMTDPDQDFILIKLILQIHILESWLEKNLMKAEKYPSRNFKLFLILRK